MKKQQNDLLVAVHSVRARASQALIKGNGSLYAKLMADLYELEQCGAAVGIDFDRKPIKQDILTPMMDNDEMWIIDPDTGNGTVIYDLPLYDC